MYELNSKMLPKNWCIMNILLNCLFPLLMLFLEYMLRGVENFKELTFIGPSLSTAAASFLIPLFNITDENYKGYNIQKRIHRLTHINIIVLFVVICFWTVSLKYSLAQDYYYIIWEWMPSSIFYGFCAYLLSIAMVFLKEVYK